MRWGRGEGAGKSEVCVGHWDPQLGIGRVPAPAPLLSSNRLPPTRAAGCPVANSLGVASPRRSFPGRSSPLAARRSRTRPALLSLRVSVQVSTCRTEIRLNARRRDLAGFSEGVPAAQPQASVASSASARGGAGAAPGASQTHS